MRHEKGYADRSDGGGISHRGYSLRLRFQRERANLTLTDPGDLDQPVVEDVPDRGDCQTIQSDKRRLPRDRLCLPR